MITRDIKITVVFDVDSENFKSEALKLLKELHSIETKWKKKHPSIVYVLW